MVRYRILAMALAINGLFGCTTTAQETTISTLLQASDYNDVASRYTERPTQVSIRNMSDGAVTLTVQMQQYGLGVGTNSDALVARFLQFESRYIDDYIARIDKYFEWADLATSRGDIITREIGHAPTWAQLPGGALQFSLVSGNAQRQYLLVEFCVGSCAPGGRVMPMHFSRDNVAILRNLLIDFKQGRLQQLDVDSVYR